MSNVREDNLALAKSLVNAWLMEKGIALTGVNGEASKSTIHRFKLDLAARVRNVLAAAREEAFRDAQHAVIRIRNTNPDRKYRAGFTAGIEAAIKAIKDVAREGSGR